MLRMTTAHLVSGEATDQISTAEVRDLLSDPDTTIVDVRPLAAYNGWRLRTPLPPPGQTPPPPPTLPHSPGLPGATAPGRRGGSLSPSPTQFWASRGSRPRSTPGGLFTPAPRARGPGRRKPADRRRPSR